MVYACHLNLITHSYFTFILLRLDPTRPVACILHRPHQRGRISYRIILQPKWAWQACPYIPSISIYDKSYFCVVEFTRIENRTRSRKLRSASLAEEGMFTSRNSNLVRERNRYKRKARIHFSSRKQTVKCAIDVTIPGSEKRRQEGARTFQNRE